ncbi:unnamed protein product [Auanema sp. JU1783]|nr:unnamed protein product [Auanema sp. JU1783]
MHVKSHGLDLICCSSIDPLLSTCEFSSYCRFEECSCHLSLRDDFECSLNSTLDTPFSWKDHAVNPNPLPCMEANLPNNDVPYQLNILHWKPRKTRSFLTGICELNVTSLSLRDISPEMGLIDFQSCLTSIQSIEINLKSLQTIDMYSMIEASENLNSLRLVNVNFELWDNISPWTQTISYFHIENSSITTLPKWLALSENLQQLFMSHTNLNSISVVSQLSHLRSAKLSHNKINDLSKSVLNNRELYDLDLSHNLVSSIASYTFINCPELRVLDLSYNPLSSLPYKPFAKNTKLKWLKLDGTNIHTLSTDHFAGLTSLKTLSLSRTPLKVISPYSFLPLKSLKMLNLESTNLTRVPAAVTQNCGLTHLNLANNFLHRHTSLPPETLVMLSSLSQLQIDGNPLMEFPPSLLLLSKDNARLYRQLIQTMTTLPVWTKVSCTPYYWNLHLGNRQVMST